MWDRKNLKQRAKATLMKDYWKAFLISLVIAVASGGARGSGGGAGYNFDKNDNPFKNMNWDNPFKNFTWDHPFQNMEWGHPFQNMGWDRLDWTTLVPILLIMGFVMLMALVLAVGIRLFIGYPLEVGGRRYFIRTAEEADNKLCFTFAFKSKHYMKIVLSMLLRDIQLFLWFLLLIIPGIIKSYQYRMVPYILAQNPQIGAKEAIALSRRMTDGSKFRIFILDLSFLGWYLLGVLACCIGVLFVQPYVDMTMAELYIDLRRNALEKGACLPADLEPEAAV